MLEDCKQEPIFEPKFIFYKTDKWKNIHKDSRDALNFLLKNLKKILKFLIHLHILKIFQNIIKLFMKQT